MDPISMDCNEQNKISFYSVVIIFNFTSLIDNYYTIRPIFSNATIYILPFLHLSIRTGFVILQMRAHVRDAQNVLVTRLTCERKKVPTKGDY